MDVTTSKYQFVEQPAAPAKCIACNNDVKPDEPLIDTTASLDYYGAILFCISCAKELATLIGFVDEDEINKEVELSNELAQRLAEEKKKVEALENVVSAYGNGRFTPTDEPDTDVPVDKKQKSGKQDSEDTEPRLFE